jgi:putative hemolysin
MQDLWVELTLIFALILVNGFFACSEMAIIAVRKSRLKELAEQGNRRARTVLQLLEDSDRFLATIQIGITVVSASAAAVGGVAAIEVIKPWIQGIPYPAVQRASESLSVGLVVVVFSYLSLVLGELIPKSIALHNAERIALHVAPVILRLSTLLSFAIRLLTFSGKVVLKLTGTKIKDRAFVSEDEIKLLIREGRERGVFDQTEQELIHSVFEFTDISVKEVMVPLPKIQAIQLDTPIEQVLTYVAERRFSRYPVHKEGINDICGVLYDKDLLAAISRKVPVQLRELLHPVYFVPETMKVSVLLKELQRRRMQMAIVVDEYGNVQGLVTMEDLLEEIVGEIRDEVDHAERLVERLRDGSLVLDASLSVRDLRQEWGLPIPESTAYETVGGFVLSQLQGMPRGGEIIQHGEYKFTVVDMANRRIAKVKVEKLTTPAERLSAKV